MRNTLRFLLGNLHGFDPRAPCGAARGAGGARSLGARAYARRCRRRSSSAYRALRLPPHLPEGAQLLHRGPRGLLPRRHQGPSLHHPGRRCARAARRRPRCSTSPRAWCAGSRRSCRSPRRRRGVTCPASAASRCSTSTWHELPEVPADGIDWNALIALRSDVTRELEKLRDAGHHRCPARCARRCLLHARASTRASRRWERSCASCFITSEAQRASSPPAPPRAPVPAVSTGSRRRLDRGRRHR